jgi:hypothetical protein
MLKKLGIEVSEAHTLVIAIVSSGGLRLCIVAHCVSGGLARLLKRVFSRDRLCLPVVELTLSVDVQPASSVGVLVALNLTGLALPLVV